MRLPSFLQKSFFFWLFVLFFLAVLILARDKISPFLSFKSGQRAPVVDLKSVLSTTTIILPSGSTSSGNASGLPLYKGREPAEVKSDPAEVAIFNQEQREKIYAEIRLQAAAVKENPGFVFGWLQIGLLKKTVGDFVGARDAWEYVSLLRPENFLSFANLGELYWHYLPDFPRSEKNFKIAIKHKPDDPALYVSLSDLYSYSYKEKENQAEQVLLDGIGVNPEDLNLWKVLAYLYERQRNYSKALEWWQKVSEKEPGNKDIISTVESLKKKLQSPVMP